MNDTTLPAHSVLEAHLFVEVNPCPVCRHGARKVAEARLDLGGRRLRLIAVCENCGSSDECLFDLPWPGARLAAPQPDDPLNPGGEPSSLIDLIQWLTLYQLRVESARCCADKPETLRRRIEAAMCLDEALRFLPSGREEAPDSALFAPASRQTRDHDPQRYTRSRIVELRRQLPTPGLTDTLAREHPARKPWWKLW